MISTTPFATSLNSSERVDLLRLARTEGIGPVNFRRLLTEYPTAGEALHDLPRRMQKAGRQKSIVIPTKAEIEDELAALGQFGARLVLRGDPEYPPLLAAIPDAPPALTLRGNAQLLTKTGIGIVGARNASAAGLRLAETISAGLAQAGVVVVSGLARGIDAIAHRAALYRGLTVGAIAGGIDQIYPPEHDVLHHDIACKGCLITEAPFGTVPQGRHFPRRNRLIAGLTSGTLIIEAAAKSGTLITARMALDYGREVFAVPGSPLDPRSMGGNDLLRQGATLTESADDILTALPMAETFTERTSHQREMGFYEDVTPWNDLGTHKDAVLQCVAELLSPTPIAVDDIVQHCQFSVSAVTAALAELELGEVAAFLPGGHVVRLPKPSRDNGCLE